MADLVSDIEQTDFVPIAAAAALLGYHKQTLYRFAGEGRIALIRRAGRTGVEPAELERFRRAETRPFVPGDRTLGR